MGTKKLTNKYVVLPIKLMKKVEEIKFTRMQKDKVVKLLSIMLKCFLRDEIALDEYREFPVNFWKKAICSHYERVMDRLTYNTIVQVNKFYGFGKCMSYRINPDLLNGRVKVFTYKDKDSRKVDGSYVAVQTRKILRKCKMSEGEAFSFIYNYVASEKIEASLKYNGTIKVEGSIEVKYYKGKKPVVSSLQHAIHFALNSGMDLIQDKKKFVVARHKEYIQQKKKRVYYHYMMQACMLTHKDIYANRNDTNNRLDSNLTTIPSKMIHLIKLEGESLISIDLKNSQFVFLAALIKEGFFDEYIRENLKNSKPLIKKKKVAKISSYSLIIVNNGTHSVPYSINNNNYLNKGDVVDDEGDKIKGIIAPDTYMCAKMEVVGTKSTKKGRYILEDIARFVKLAEKGELYEFIQDELGLPVGEEGRKLAKGMMFEIFFSKARNRSASKSKLRKLFSLLVGMIDSYKKDMRAKRKREMEMKGEEYDNLGDNQFAITLQKKESEVFIDTILTELLKKGYKVLSKHDSILCKKSDLREVLAFVGVKLDAVLGRNKFNLKLEQ